MIIIKTKQQIQRMKDAGKIVAETHALLKEAIRPGISTFELDQLAERFIQKSNAQPSFKGYRGFRGSICASVNDVVVHGIPSKEIILEEGDIISIDIGAFYKGYHGDSAKTHPVGEISQEDADLIKATRGSFYEALKQAVPGNRLSDISQAVQAHVEKLGYSVVREFVGHGIGQQMHEDPPVPNYGEAGRGPRLSEGMVLAVEPMINQGTWKVHIMQDGWTAKTLDGKKSAHYEHTLAITKDLPILLTTLS